MGKSSRAPKQTRYRYRKDMWFGWSLGPVDGLKRLVFGEKTGWEGDFQGHARFSISNRELFGGDEKEGGIEGDVEFLPGGASQVIPERLATLTGETSATMPAHRGVCSLWLSSVGGFLWGASPYLKDVHAQFWRAPKGLGLAMIGDDANPAAIIYEVSTNPEWGAGRHPTSLNKTSFLRCGQTLADEKFGLSFRWERQAEAEDFIQDILNHIQATIFDNPLTGKTEMRLLRKDYDENALDIISVENARLLSFQRPAFAEIPNEIVVTWTNPANEEEETVTDQDLAAIGVQGGVVSDSRNYNGIRSAALALKAARRERLAASAVLAAGELEVDRSFRTKALPGSVFRLIWPDEGLDDVIRVQKVDFGTASNRTIKMDFTLDVFAVEEGVVLPPPPTLSPVDSTPVPVSNYRALSAPAFFVRQSEFDLSEGVYPDIVPMFLAEAPSPAHYEFDLWAPRVQPAGDLTWALEKSVPFSTRQVLSEPLVAEAHSAGVAGLQLVAGSFYLIGNEIVLSTGDGGLDRGMLDTVPEAWSAGTVVWSMGLSEDNLAALEQVAGGTYDYRFLTRTRSGRLDFSEAPVVEALLDDRPWRPIRPANVSVEGVSFGDLDLSSGGAATITVGWKNRNRLTEEVIALRWTDDSLAPEAGQTTTIRIRQNEQIVHVASDLTGEGHTINLVPLGLTGAATLEVSSTRDGLESYASHRIGLILPSA